MTKNAYGLANAEVQNLICRNDIASQLVSIGVRNAMRLQFVTLSLHHARQGCP